MNRLPVVAIVGRPNVGKSSLLNALVGKRISIVQDMPGVTRDRISTPLKLETPDGDRYIELVDTGGYGFVDSDNLTDHIRQQIELAMTRADLVLLVVDCQAGTTSADETIAAMLRDKGLKTVLLANKADGPKGDVMLGDFARLGLGTPVGVSALNGRNADQIFEAIAANLDLADAPTTMPVPHMLVAIVGKRNAGKSTLVNSIAEIYDGSGDRVIVSEVPGTTRDSVDVRFEKEGKTLIVIDTAGVRKKRHMVTNDVEFYSFHRAQRSIRRADVVLMLIDGTEKISEPDKKLAQYIAEQYKPVALVVNKWDLVLADAKKQAEEKGAAFSSDLLMQEFAEYLGQELKHLDYAPIAFITAKDGKKVQTVLDVTQHLFRQSHERVSTAKVNAAIRTIMEERGPSTKFGRRARVYYATQTDVAPPTIVMFVNHVDYLSETYQRFMLNRFRELLPYPEVPVKLVVRQRRRDTPDESEGKDEIVASAAPRRPVSTGKAGKTGSKTVRRAAGAGGKRAAVAKPQPRSKDKRGPARGARPHR